MGEVGESNAAIDAAEEAVLVARGIGAHLLELRAATDLAIAHMGAGRNGEAQEVLQPVFSWFTEGFDAPDLVAARAVLDRI